MSNLYDLEKLIEQRRAEMNDAASKAERLRLLRPDDSRARTILAVPELRCRIGLMLIRLGSRLAA